MMSESTRRVPFPALPDISDLIDPLQLLFGWRQQQQQPETYGIRIETHAEGNTYVVRAELPGIDPAKDVEVTVTDGVLTMHAQRTEQQTERHHSEFRYGSYSRSVRLPEGAKAEKVTAAYQAGVLTVSIPMDKPAKAVSHKIKVVATD
jgi:HSP20 family protein